ncbi:hypothetical protein P175DRAFT_0149011 [Aspergillus ochraceoroseus IBT 24754]|uniref:Uncharacterized protein n=1 Tax=Aspergillus ochraceoroseus IBT 24754 TaxID=1392256 RepID=A0A2T5M2V4_9EURO|nr:uncharacterized protein P175DRAFT_0149011 [Aspergillus ochraceoroseus IBT 24754]PTU22880.1 hypothetical protein P175DRAFT_0149011 [Aspergillus ochraceoroseus IBT 24754]
MGEVLGSIPSCSTSFCIPPLRRVCFFGFIIASCCVGGVATSSVHTLVGYSVHVIFLFGCLLGLANNQRATTIQIWLFGLILGIVYDMMYMLHIDIDITGGAFHNRILITLVLVC